MNVKDNDNSRTLPVPFPSLVMKRSWYDQVQFQVRARATVLVAAWHGCEGDKARSVLKFSAAKPCALAPAPACPAASTSAQSTPSSHSPSLPPSFPSSLPPCCRSPSFVLFHLLPRGCLAMPRGPRQREREREREREGTERDGRAEREEK